MLFTQKMGNHIPFHFTEVKKWVKAWKEKSEKKCIWYDYY